METGIRIKSMSDFPFFADLSQEERENGMVVAEIISCKTDGRYGKLELDKFMVVVKLTNGHYAIVLYPDEDYRRLYLSNNNEKLAYALWNAQQCPTINWGIGSDVIHVHTDTGFGKIYFNDEATYRTDDFHLFENPA